MSGGEALYPSDADCRCDGLLYGKSCGGGESGQKNQAGGLAVNCHNIDERWKEFDIAGNVEFQASTMPLLINFLRRRIIALE